MSNEEFQEEPNFFDELQVNKDFDEQVAEEISRREKAFWERHDHSLHKIFAQSEEGKFILEHWKKRLIRESTAVNGDSRLDIGLKEGRKNFIRDIIETIERVENE